MNVDIDYKNGENFLIVLGVRLPMVKMTTDALCKKALELEKAINREADAAALDASICAEL